MKDVKVVIGANYGDEGKGLMTRHFVLDAKRNGSKPIVIFHNGTAQRGHTVDYTKDFRHVYHHFCSGTADGAPTFFAETFLIHPMEYHREYNELIAKHITPPLGLFDPRAMVITPFDMIVDHATEEWIAKLNGEREFGSCGFGSWCAAEDRIPMGRTAYTIQDFMHYDLVPMLMEEVWKDCLSILIARGVKIEETSFAHMLTNREHTINNFIADLKFFFSRNGMLDFHNIFNNTVFNSFIFENGQGLGLDMNVDNPWHTTSNTGMTNPYRMLFKEDDYQAEVCYVTRSYLTRHGIGPMEQEVKKKEINAEMVDKTNVHNDFQGSLRYGFNENNHDMVNRIIDDFKIVMGNTHFKYNLAVTHTNEFNAERELVDFAKYTSDNPFEVKENIHG